MLTPGNKCSLLPATALFKYLYIIRALINMPYGTMASLLSKTNFSKVRTFII